VTYTVEQRDQLKAAIAKGVTRLRMGNEEVQFDSLDQMLRRLALMDAELAGQTGASRQVYPQFVERPR
jgi:hypothetical protein